MIIPHLAFLKFQLRLESPFSIMNICSPIFFLFYSSKVVKVGFRPLFSPVYNFDPLLHSTWLPESDNIQDNLRANGKGSKFGLVFLPPLSFLTFCLTTSIFSTPLFPLNEFTAVKVRGSISFHCLSQCQNACKVFEKRSAFVFTFLSIYNFLPRERTSPNSFLRNGPLV